MKHVERKEHNKGMKVFLFEKSKYSGKTKIKTIRSCKLNQFFSVIKKNWNVYNIITQSVVFEQHYWNHLEAY